MFSRTKKILSVLQYHAKLNTSDLAFSVWQTALKVQHQYSTANIPTIDPCDILKEEVHPHEKYNGLNKSKSRATGQTEKNKANFVGSLKNLFDVAHHDALSMINIKEDRDFLEAQRGSRESKGR